MDIHSVWQWIVAAVVVSLPFVKRFGWPIMKGIFEFVGTARRVLKGLEAKDVNGIAPLEALRETHAIALDLRGRQSRTEEAVQELQRDVKVLAHESVQHDRRLKLVERPHRAVNES